MVCVGYLAILKRVRIAVRDKRAVKGHPDLRRTSDVRDVGLL